MAIATDPFTRRDGDQDMSRDIETRGWHIVSVAETAESPGWAFTVGLHRSYAHPEIVIVGLPVDSVNLLKRNHLARWHSRCTTLA